MRQPSLGKTSAVSLIFHVIILLMFNIALKNSSSFRAAEVYSVNLVAPLSAPPPLASAREESTIQEKETAPEQKTVREEKPMPSAPAPKIQPKQVSKPQPLPLPKTKEPAIAERIEKLKKKEPSVTDRIEQMKRERSVKERINQLQSESEKKRERLDNIADKRKDESLKQLKKIVDIRSKKSDIASTGKTGDAGGKTVEGVKGTSDKSSSPYADFYKANISSYIKQNWVYPEIDRTGLETVISFHIAADGTVSGIRIERTSGNSLYDASARMAIMKSTPLPKPPMEMDIGIRFLP